MKSLQTLMSEIDQRIKKNAENKHAKQGSLLFDQEQERTAQHIKDNTNQLQQRKSSHLVPHRHRQGDFFIADILDAIPKGDLASMEHPLFALKAGDMRVRTYERNGLMVTESRGMPSPERSRAAKRFLNRLGTGWIAR
jgi:hypothetical protein